MPIRVYGELVTVGARMMIRDASTDRLYDVWSDVRRLFLGQHVRIVVAQYKAPGTTLPEKEGS